MTNYCENELTVVGRDEDVEKVFEFIKSDCAAFDFNTVISSPDNFCSPDYEREWYRDNWNSLSNAIRSERCRNKMFFETSWYPPTKVITTLARMFPRVSFHIEYFECGTGYCGGYSCLNKSDWSSMPDDCHISNKPIWQAGKRVCKWECQDYKGWKGG